MWTTLSFVYPSDTYSITFVTVNTLLIHKSTSLNLFKTGTFVIISYSSVFKKSPVFANVQLVGRVI